MCFGKGENLNKDVLEQLMGSMKKYQWRATLACYLIEIFVAWHLLSHGIMVPATTPIYCNNTNHTIHDMMTRKELKILYSEACSPECPEIVVSKRYYDNTIIHQYKLYCGNRYMFSTAAQMITMLGALVGSFLFGFLADSWGRKKTLMLASLFIGPFGSIVAVSPNIYCFLVSKFFLNFFLGGAVITTFVLFSELVGVRWRPIVGLLSQFPFNLGHLSLAGLAYIFRDWRWFQLTISLPALLTLCYYWVLPESPRWLLAIGKIEEGIEQIKYIAEYNGLNPGIVEDVIMTGNLQIIPAAFSMFALAMSFPVIFIYTGEVFPTPVRNMAMGTCSALSRVGAILAAIVADLRHILEWLPPIVFSILMFVAVFGFTFLPETTDIVLPDTVEEVENLKQFKDSLSSMTSSV